MFRWLTVAGAALFLGGSLLGYLGAILMPVAAATAFASLLAGSRWLDTLPSLRAVERIDLFFLSLASSEGFVASWFLLRTPSLYVLFWFGCAALVVHAFAFARHKARSACLCAASLGALFLLPALVVRSEALIKAVKAQSAFHARLFLLAGADPNLREQHDPLLITSLRAKDADTACVLLAHGADPNSRTSAFLARTPALSEAAASGAPELVRLLLDHGADPNATNTWGETPLARALRAGKPATAKLLMTHGARAP